MLPSYMVGTVLECPVLILIKTGHFIGFTILKLAIIIDFTIFGDYFKKMNRVGMFFVSFDRE